MSPTHSFALSLVSAHPDENDVSLDSSVQWRHENGRKVGGTVTTRSADEHEIVYALSRADPVFFRGTVCGRSAICWSAQDPVTGDKVVVKDSWKSSERMSEHIYLQEAIGIPGVVQMVSCEPGRCERKDLRALGFHNRIETRIMTKAYAESIKNFTSARQLLCALRGSIAGHMELHKKGILHPDVSINNILNGNGEAEPGFRGILINLDMAIYYAEELAIKSPDWRIGTRLFQSACLISSAKKPFPFPRDHLDDLESFLYLLAHIMLCYDATGVFHSSHDTVMQWDQSNTTLACQAIQGFLANALLPDGIEARWPAPCVSRLNACRGYTLTLAFRKLSLLGSVLEARKNKVKDLVNSDAHYAQVLHFFDKTIAALDRTERVGTTDNTNSAEPITLSPFSSWSSSSNSWKTCSPLPPRLFPGRPLLLYRSLPGFF